MVCNTAIFYDIENLLGLFSGKTNTVLHLDEIFRRVHEIEGVHGVSIQRAYADWAIPQCRNLRNSVLQVGIEPIQIFNTNQNDKVKNAADVSLIIDAVDLIAKCPEVENYVIASGDGIFAFLAKKLHENGKRVIGCSFAGITNIIFKNACDYFISIEKTDTSIVATATVTKKKKPTVTIDNSADLKIESKSGKLPKSKYTEALESAKIEIWRDSKDISGCLHVVRKIIEALFVESTSHLPSLEISVLTLYVSHYVPGFKMDKNGFKRVGEFVRFILTGSPYCMHSVDDNVLRIAPRNVAKGIIHDDVKGLSITSSEGKKYDSVFDVPAGEPFIFAMSAKMPVAEPEPGSESEPDPGAEQVIKNSIRKKIKNHFEELSAADALQLSEIRKLTTAEYAQATFGVRTPILKEIETRSNLAEQRTANGKIKYWKESFRFNGKTYLVYKEWVAGLHEERFMAWLASFKK
ncbi:MAG: NYN domain-containing protein [Clostridiales bacterium]|jgi:hypothetical protein|nr:NYN domain-containing protein [Clostridiales bacterium]